MQALEKKRPKEEKEIAQRLKPLAKLQTAEDYDKFVDGILCELSHNLRCFSWLNNDGFYRGVYSSQKDTGAAVLPTDGSEDDSGYRAI